MQADNLRAHACAAERTRRREGGERCGGGVLARVNLDANVKPAAEGFVPSCHATWDIEYSAVWDTAPQILSKLQQPTNGYRAGWYGMLHGRPCCTRDAEFVGKDVNFAQFLLPLEVVVRVITTPLRH